jgi:NADH-quinone oxidoreductase subunit N
MQRIDLIALGPLLALTATVALVMLQIALLRRHVLTLVLTLAGLAAALATLPAAAARPALAITPLLTMNALALFFIALIVLATAATALLGYGYLSQMGGHREEFYLLLLIAAAGAAVLVSSRHFSAFFIGLEILSVSLYALIAYPRHRPQSVEAGLKYLVLAAASAAFLLFGMALIYSDSGTLDFAALSARGALAGGQGRSLMLLAGTAMVVVGVGFKLALVPFHMWTADVYQGAPAPVTAFVATVSKGAVVALMVRLLAPIDPSQAPSLFRLLGILAFASMVGGNLLALWQQRVKRILAYSSIAHLGYLLVAFLSASPSAIAAVMFYITAYTVSVMGAFGVVSVLSARHKDADALDDFRGLFYRHPWLAAVFSAMLLSLAGIPLTAGFIAKFYVIAAGAQGRIWFLVITLLATSGVGLFYYLRIIVVLFDPRQADASSRPQERVDFSGAIVLTMMMILLVWIGSLPEPLLELIQTALR